MKSLLLFGVVVYAVLLIGAALNLVAVDEGFMAKARQSEFLAATMGAIMYHLAKFRWFKDRKEKTHQKVSAVQHFKESYDDWAWSGFWILVAELWGKDMIRQYYEIEGVPYEPIHVSWYLLLAPAVDLVYEAGKVLAPIIKKKVIDKLRKALE